MKAGEVGIDPFHGSTRGKAQHKLPLGGQFFSNDPSGQKRCLIAIGNDDDFQKNS